MLKAILNIGVGLISMLIVFIFAALGVGIYLRLDLPPGFGGFVEWFFIILISGALLGVLHDMGKDLLEGFK